MPSLVYSHLTPGAPLPEGFTTPPFKAVIIAETAVPAGWQASVSDWLVRSGCLYTMAWGVSCSSWDDAVDMANIGRFPDKEVPEEKFVLTTWHDDETLSEVFWFCKHSVFHLTVNLQSTLLLHIAAYPREREIMAEYARS